MPFFIRTRRLDIKRLERKPQEDLSVVHAILSGTVNDVQMKLKKAERAYYGPGKNARDELKKWTASVKAVMQLAQLSNLVSARTIEAIIKDASDPKRKFRVDLYDLNKVKECYRKVRENNPDKFSDILIDAKGILKYLEKYCLSFYDPETDADFDTAQHYEKQRRDYAKTIRESLDAVMVLPEKFKASELWLSEFSSYGIELARQGECTCAPFLVIFPECCERLREACTAMLNWIDADSSYSEFISNDIRDLEQKKEESAKTMRDNQQRYHQVVFRLKQSQGECDKMQVELDKLKDKEDEMVVEEEMLVSETNDMQLDIERKEYRREDLIRNAAAMHPQILYERYSEIAEELRDLKMRLPFVKRQLFNVRYKLGWIGEKKGELRLEERKLKDLRKELDLIDKTKEESEEEHDNTLKALALARQIHLYKSCPDAVEKIYHEQPVEINNARLPGNRGKEDPFERGCQLVAANIESDWPKLYRHLVFYPPRGTTTIDRDVYELSNLAARTSPQEVCIRSLYKWRRFHTRAKLEDIRDALADIKRPDILQVLQDELNPAPEEESDDEDRYAFLEPYLVPYFKEVEKFDELKAANKI